MTPGVLFQHPRSVIMFGDDRPLLNWVAWAIASESDPEFFWPDVRLAGQAPDSTDPMAHNVIPERQLRVRPPNELVPDHSAANVAVSAVIRDDEPPENVRRLIDFLRLPRNTQQVLAEPRSDGRMPVVVLSNAQRLAPLYPSVDNVHATARTITEQNAVLIMTFADTPPTSRSVFEVILHVVGSLRDGWKWATLRVEKGTPDSAFPTGLSVRLGEFTPLAPALLRALG